MPVNGSRGGPWTAEELSTLTAIWRALGTESKIADVYEAYRRALPATSRSRHSVEIRLSALRAAERVRKRRGEQQSEEESNESDNIEQEDEEDDPEEGEEKGGEHDAGSSGTDKASPSATSYKTNSSGKQLPCATAAAASRGPGPRGTPQVPIQSFPANILTNGPASHLDVTIDRMPDGFKIFGLPPGYGVLITSPLDCQVVSPTWCDEHEQEAAASPFAFKRLHDGSIEGVSYPLGTRANMSLIKASEGGGAQVGANVGSEALVQTTFISADHFRVLFVNEVS